MGESEKFDELSLKGHGVVPVRIESIIQSPNDEIKFVVSGISEKYDTFNYSFPVPVYKEKHPFVAKATLCYFPKCSRNQGVDYTNTELDLYFGRLNNVGKLLTINKNKQEASKMNLIMFMKKMLEKPSENGIISSISVNHSRRVLKPKNL